MKRDEDKSKLKYLTGKDFWNTADIDGRKGIRFSDGPAGVRRQKGRGDRLGFKKSEPSICFPSHSALAQSFNKSLVKSVGAHIGNEAYLNGVDILLAPDLNIKRYPLCGRNFEYFSEDAYLNGVLGASYVSGVQSSGAGACIKHFAVNNREFARTAVNSVVDLRTLNELYLTPFEIAVKESKPFAVMTAYNLVNGAYCSENGYLFNKLRNEWGFDGITVSDWGGTVDRVKSAEAGLDIEMPACKLSFEELKKALDEGKADGKKISACIQRIEKAFKRKAENNFAPEADFEKMCANECPVLLKNEGALPLKTKNAVIIGEAAARPVFQGAGSSKVNVKNVRSLKDILNFKFAYGYKGNKRSKRLERSALKLVKGADAVIFCMSLCGGDAEGADRENMRLPENQILLLKEVCKLNKNVIAVLFCGCTVETDWDRDVNAFLYAGLLGQYGAEAVASVLKGDINPSGKLAETFYKAYEKNYEESPYCSLYTDGLNVGYLADGNEVKYPFGFGLSYTSFCYSDLKIEEGGIYVTVKNTGERYGGEAVQTYIKYPDGAKQIKPVLKGFEKVFLNAGEERTVFIPFDNYAFRNYDAINSRFVCVSGEYEISVGSSSADIYLKGKLYKSGDTEEVPAPDIKSLKPETIKLNRTAKGRVIADLNTPFCELKNAKGAFGRIFSRFALFVLRKNKVSYGSLEYLPLRTLAQFGKLSSNRLNGLITAFNGKFLKGIFKFIFNV